ncbi:MAG: cysteine dioxygenase [Betaproteobacteria bacterium]|nr:cysteine dioxygenase [Betaproteobacteria bacterium]
MNTQRFRHFIAEFTRLVERAGNDEKRIHAEGATLLADIVRHDDWLPDEYAKPHAQYYQQYLLYCDPLERFSVVSFVWGPGQKTPVHNHTVWGLLGVMRGAELCHRYDVPTPGKPMRQHPQEQLKLGEIDKVSPTVGDIHEVANAYADRVSISIHVYGANIGAVKRHVFDAASGTAKDFVSGYSNTTLPNVWDRSAEVRATL